MKYLDKNDILSEKGAGDCTAVPDNLLFDGIILGKFIINGTHCRFKAGFGYTDDDILLGRPLVDHADIDICLGNSFENTACRALRLDHTAADNGNQRKVIVICDGIGLNALADLVDDQILDSFQISVVQDDTHCIDTGR